MQDQSTDHLDHQLKSTSLENFSDYLKNLQQLPSLQDFFSVYIAKHDLKISQIIKNSGISQSYAHEILNGTKPHPSRDHLHRRKRNPHHKLIPDRIRRRSDFTLYAKRSRRFYVCFNERSC